ncbi:MAG: c-type cytochrome [Solirubrobacteraceae bacterium]
MKLLLRASSARRRRSPARTGVALAVALVLGALALTGIAQGDRLVPHGSPPAGSSSVPRVFGHSPSQVAEGRQLFVAGCSYCHGFDAGGIAGRGPSLIGVGAQAPDFYLSTGRMPLSDPRDYPERSKPAYPRPAINALVAYIATLGGPPIPAVNPGQGNLSTGEQAFALHCAGCHQIIARGGIVTGSVAPALQNATASEIGEAVRVGPYLMPRFSSGEISAQTLNSIARYILYTRHPADQGGWGIGHIGPIPEGMIGWLIALASLLIVARLIGERTA